MIYRRYIKRFLDIVISLCGILLLWPLMAVIALLVRWKLGAPVLFCQQRPGLQGRLFPLYKFRTMTDQRDGEGRLLPDGQRLTAFGRFLRSTSLDELPELFCILKGQMSLIGPRPLLASYLSLYTEEQGHRHDVRPGLTGLAQVNGRNALTWEERFAYDLQYVKEISFRLDLAIFFKTVVKVLRREGISGAGSDTMAEFTGSGAGAHG